jgi:hypothetical protein
MHPEWLPPGTSCKTNEKEEIKYMTHKWRFTTAVIIAPLAAPLVMFFLIFLNAESLKQFILSGTTQYSGYLSSFEIVMFAGIVVIFGIPLYFIFKKFNLINYWSLSIGSAAIAAVPLILMGFTEGIKKVQENSMTYFAFAVCGFVVGSIFYIINELKDPNQNAREGR